MKNKTKRILIIVGVVLLTILTFSMFMSFFGKNQLNDFKHKVEDVFVDKTNTVNANILKNSNFKINTSGIEIFDETNCSVGSTPLVDNWIMSPYASTDFTLFQVSNGFKCINEDSTNKFSIRQNISDEIVDYLNTELTFSISIDGVVYTSSGVLSNKWDNISIISLNESVKAFIQFDGSNITTIIEISPKNSVVLNWVKLELGDIFTGYIPPVVK